MTCEYKKAAALLSMDIDTIVSAAESNPNHALELLRLLKAKKDVIVSDEAARNTRYVASCNVFNITNGNDDE